MKTQILDWDHPLEQKRRAARPEDNFAVLNRRFVSPEMNAVLTARKFYPRLKGKRFSVGHLDEPSLNCFAHALGYSQWLAPEDVFWWPGARRSSDLRAWRETLDGFGFRDDHMKGRTVALYALDGHVTHAALRREDGLWESKLGQAFSILGHELRDLEDAVYGKVACILSLK